MFKRTFSFVAFIFFCFFTTTVLAHDGKLPLNTPDFHIAPAFGDTEILIDNDNGVRGVQHFFYWADAQADWNAYQKADTGSSSSWKGIPTGPYGGPSGMEIDTVFYGYDKTSLPSSGGYTHYVFSSGPKSESQSSRDTYWGSDMPYAYIDVTFSDNPVEPSIGIGSGHWSSASGGYYYSWSMGRDSSSNTYRIVDYDDYKVQISRTHRHTKSGSIGGKCNGSYSDPWCRFADGNTDGYIAPIKPWSGMTPGMKSWLKPTDSNLYHKGNPVVNARQNFGRQY